MSREIIYLPEVSGDFVDAFNYYEALRVNLGQKFEAAYYRAEQEIENGLMTHRRVFEHYHRVVLKKFPYILYYRLDGTKAVITGLFFAKRDPTGIKESLESRT